MEKEAKNNPTINNEGDDTKVNETLEMGVMIEKVNTYLKDVELPKDRLVDFILLFGLKDEIREEKEKVIIDNITKLDDSIEITKVLDGEVLKVSMKRDLSETYIMKIILSPIREISIAMITLERDNPSNFNKLLFVARLEKLVNLYNQ
jgi:hypothetical protein